MLRTKVLIVGGGPAGSAAASLLAREGIETVLINRDHSFVKPCGGGIPLAAFSELGIPSETVKRNIGYVRIVSPTGEDVRIRLNGSSIAIVERRDFDSALRKKAVKDGAMLYEAEFRGFSDIGRTIKAEVVMDNKIKNIEADYVIAADGVNSRVRTALNIGPVASFIAISGKVKSGYTDCCEFWFGAAHAPKFYSWVFPQSEGISAGTGSISGKLIKELWQRFLMRRGINATDAGLRGYRIPLWRGDLYNKGRVLFTGDAAGHVMPLSYEGIYYAMRSGELAASALISGKVIEYKRLWKNKFQKRFLLMKSLWEYFLKDDSHAERLIHLHKSPEVQSASMRLWLRKDSGSGSILSYLKLFSRFI